MPDPDHTPTEGSPPSDPSASDSTGSESPEESPGSLLERLRQGWNNPAYRFVFLFLLFLGIEVVFYPMLTKRFFGVVDAATRATAWLDYWIMSWFTSKTSISGNLVTLDGFAVKIIEECTGAFEVIIFAAAVMAFPTSWQKKAIGFAFGIPLLYAINVFRIIVLLIVGRYFPDIFEFMHIYFWQATLIFMITGTWLLWIFKVVRYEKEPAPTPS